MSGLQISEESVKELCDRVANLGLAYQDAIGLLGEIIATLSIPQNQQLINEKLPELVPIMVRWIDRLPSVTCPDCRGNGCEPLPHDGVIAGCGTCKGIGKVYPTTPAPPKFKVGDRVRCHLDGLGYRDADVEEYGANGKVYVTPVNGSRGLWVEESQLTEIPAPRTIELFDGAAFVVTDEDGERENVTIHKSVRDMWHIAFPTTDALVPEHRLKALIDSRWTRDPSRDQHPVGSEWVYQNGGPDSVYALNRRGYDGKYRLIHIDDGDDYWHKDIADATRGARRCDTIEIKLDK